MIRRGAIFAVFAAVLALASAPFASQTEDDQRIIAALSQNTVGITANFTGSEIFVFGAVERARFNDERDDDIDVIVAVTGPSERVVLRKKARQFGIWVNSESVEIDAAPSFYAVATSGPLAELISETEDLRHRVTVDRAIRLVGEADNVANPDEYSDAIVRIRRDTGVYYENIGAVDIINRTLFRTHIELPANIVEGDYTARVFLLRGGRVLDSFDTAIAVRKVGLERWIYNLAHEQSLLYGILSILVALLAGWGASEIFRQLRR